MRKTKKQGFTLIELLIVIAVIAILAAVVLVGMNNTKMNATDKGAIASATQILKVLELCDINGGIIMQTADVNNGGGNICNLSASYGTWPAPPKGYYYHSTVWTSVYNGTQNNMFSMYKTGATGTDRQIYCGHYASDTWTISLSGGRKNIVTGYACTQSIGGVWQ